MSQESDNRNSRDKTIDVVKGFCILWVVLGHSGNNLGVINTLVCTFYMSAFFIFSGYLFKYKSGSFKDTMIYKIKSLYPLYLFWAFSPCLLLILEGVITNRPVSFNSPLLVANILLGVNLPPVISQLWFIIALLTTELLWIIIDSIFKKQRNKLLCVIIVAGLGLLLNYLSIEVPVFRLGTSLVMMPIFYAGVIAKRRANKIILGSKKFYYLMAANIAIYILSVFLQVKVFGEKISIAGNNYGIYPFFYINAVSGTYIFYNVIKIITVCHKKVTDLVLSVFAFYGENSTILLVSMNFLIYIVGRLLTGAGLTNYVSLCTFVIVILLQLPLSKIVKSSYGRLLLVKF